MLSSRSFNRPHIAPIAAIALAASLGLSSCSLRWIPGVDRIISSNSSATVEPLLHQADDSPVLPPDAPTTTSGQVDPAPAIAMSTGAVEQDVKAPAKPTANAVPDASPPASVTVDAALSPATPAVATAAAAPKPLPVGNDDAAQSVNATAPQQAQANTAILPLATGRLRGKVSLRLPDATLVPGAETIVTLASVAGTSVAKISAPETHSIDMENKIYSPRYLTISKDDKVSFVNKDQIRHNVFSSSGNNAFDLGTYGAGLKRAVTLRESGIVKVYCNIHADMATFIAVAEPGLGTLSDLQGNFTLGNLPVGDYRLHLWNIRGEEYRDIRIEADADTELAIVIEQLSTVVEEHKNKFGADYPDEFADEFY